jgi:hypothetical protein
VRGLAPRADNLIDDSRHGFITYFTGGVPHMKYALQSVVLATLFYKRDSGPGVGELASINNDGSPAWNLSILEQGLSTLLRDDFFCNERCEGLQANAFTSLAALAFG